MQAELSNRLTICLSMAALYADLCRAIDTVALPLRRRCRRRTDEIADGAAGTATSAVPSADCTTFTKLGENQDWEFAKGWFPKGWFWQLFPCTNISSRKSFHEVLPWNKRL